MKFNLNQVKFKEAARSFVKGLSNAELRLIDERGARLYAYLTESRPDAYRFDVSIGSPIDRAQHEFIECNLHHDAAVWASSGSFFEAWQEEPGTLAEVRESILFYLLESMPDNLLAAYWDKEDRGDG